MVKALEVRDNDATHLLIELFGGDNNLSVFIDRDLREMEKGMDGPFTVLALVDRAGFNNSVIEELSPRTGTNIIGLLGEVDTGDPETLADFIASALISYPNAQHIALGFWDHGTGIFEENDPMGAGPGLGSHGMMLPQHGAARRLFIPRNYMSLERMKAMLHDSTSGGLLTNKEASQVLSLAFERAGFKDKKLDMIFSDTCLNGMVEVLTQFAPYAHVITGSEDLERGNGWNYQKWFKKLAQTPPLDGRGWGQSAVEAYAEHYEKLSGEHPVTLAAFRTDIDLSIAFKHLVDTLIPLGAAGFEWVCAARQKSQGFDHRDSYDLRHFAAQLAGTASQEASLCEACGALIQSFDQARIASVKWGESVQDAQGLALWIPSDRDTFSAVAPTYRDLDFSIKTGWLDYLAPFFA